MTDFPKIESVYALPNHHLLVLFKNGRLKTYDCAPLLREAVFKPLESEALFSQVQVGPGGYGIVWNEEIDLSESELWLNGVEAENILLKDLLLKQDATR